MLVFLCLSCQNRDEGDKSDGDCREELFYYKNDEVQFIDNLLLNDWLFVGFDQQVQDKEIISYINKTDFFKSIDASNILRPNCDESRLENEYTKLFVNTKKHHTCSQLKEIIRILEQSSIGAVADLAFCLSSSDCSVVMSYTSGIIVQAKDVDDLSSIYALVQETNTRIDEAWDYASFIPGYFIIRVNKNSKGNAMQMANYFYETGTFLVSEPYPVLSEPISVTAPEFD